MKLFVNCQTCNFKIFINHPGKIRQEIPQSFEIICSNCGARHDGTFPTILSLAKVIDHPMFSDLPLMRTKSIVTGSNDKGSKIYQMYFNNRQKFSQYATGDTHDTLLIFEEIFRRYLKWGTAVT